jgi:hypothetical protein
VHVWSFVVQQHSEDGTSRAQWTWLYDVPTNGNTIETVGFRLSKETSPQQQMLSKSSDMCVRVWNLFDDSVVEDTSVASVTADSSTEKDMKENTDGIPVSKKGESSDIAPVVQCQDSHPQHVASSAPQPPLAAQSTANKGKLSYEDIPGTNDCRIFCGDGYLAFGGVYEFAAVQLQSSPDRTSPVPHR